mmetsp:Transcript_39324/g.76986  ORF Transcript_39324/g.76986 Transcript_39324/m.76986 type:complete len:218 (+) Transcript_39324:411-1064(+)
MGGKDAGEDLESRGGHRRASVAASETESACTDNSFFSTCSVMVGGENFGFSFDDLITLEACVVEASDLVETRGGGEEVDPCVKYFEKELGALTRSFNDLKVRALCIHEDEESHSRPIEDQDIQREGLRLKHRIAELLRELDEQEWSYGSGEEEGGGCLPLDDDDEGERNFEGRLRRLELDDDASSSPLRSLRGPSSLNSPSRKRGYDSAAARMLSRV